MQPLKASQHPPVDCHVSILTRPEGRVQPGGVGCGPHYCCFNPHPAFWPGATLLPFWDASDGQNEFQSSPGQKAGCNVIDARLASLCHYLFQSSPGQKAGCNLDFGLSHKIIVPCFNPHPARRPGATVPGGRMCRWLAGFNPHPARRPGATLICARVVPRFVPSFNPHPARRPGATSRACN